MYSKDYHVLYCKRKAPYTHTISKLLPLKIGDKIRNMKFHYGQHKGPQDTSKYQDYNVFVIVLLFAVCPTQL